MWTMGTPGYARRKVHHPRHDMTLVSINAGETLELATRLLTLKRWYR